MCLWVVGGRGVSGSLLELTDALLYVGKINSIHLLFMTGIFEADYDEK